MRLKLINKFFCLSNIPKKCWRGAFIVQTESTCDVYLLSSHLLHVDERKSLLRKERFFRCARITAACLPSTHIFLLFSLVFIMMVCYFYIFQRFNLQLFFASHTHFTFSFYKLSLPLSKDPKRFNILSFISFLRAFFLL